ncbi:MAG: cyclohexa-1,5-dienecarbonyl-CoA hydratase [Candidatus Neomarinimicrobiota bacterium]|nr:MAG: cyclohexa-1,5-dienecarbonyl-CoA hydratase [Candidatus Neomarinimicrobiota bacterium]
MSLIRQEAWFEGAVQVLALNAPPGNILDTSMITALQNHLKNIGESRDTKCIVLTGEGKHFSFGASVEEHRKEQAGAMLDAFHALFETLMDLSVPTVAMITGRSPGGGFELALMCDFMFADSSCLCGQPEINLGVFAPPASLILPLKIGQAQAEKILLTGENVSAERLMELGLLTEWFPDQASMVAGVREWTHRSLLSKSGSSLRFAVRAARWNFHRELRQGLPELRSLYVEQLMETRDANEGIQSFLEKRKPNWSNQ